MDLKGPTNKSRSHTPALPIRLCAASIPFVAVAVGLYLLSNAWVAIAIYYSGVIIYVHLIGREQIAACLFKGWNSKSLLVCAPVFASAGGAVLWLWPHAVLPGVSLAGYMSDTGLGEWRFTVFAIVFCLINPVMEEVFWRGCFASNPGRPSWTDAAFAGYHVPVALMVTDNALSVTAFTVLFLTAWYLRYLRYRLNGLATAILAHLIADISIMTAFWLLLKNSALD